MAMQWAKKQTGFTIVELLIVVVVIAILAAITIVSYNGISERARVSAAASFASQLKHRDLTDAVGYWSFDECSGSTVTNSAGSAGASTTTSGTINWSTDTPTGSGCSLSFNGSMYVNTGISLSNEYYRKSAWIKTTSSGNIISDSSPGANSAFYLPGGKLSTGHNGSWGSVQASNTTSDGKWHFVTAEYIRNGTANNGSMTLTVDGSIVGSTQSLSIMTNTPSGVTQLIGAYTSSSYFSGLMDDVMIVTR